jgi:alpha,alpha-trehalase
MKAAYLLLLSLNVSTIYSQSPDQLYGDLFHAVQIRQTFPDTKTFCDAVLRNQTLDKILSLYHQEQNKTTFNLTAFDLDRCILPSVAIITHDINGL